MINWPLAALITFAYAGWALAGLPGVELSFGDRLTVYMLLGWVISANFGWRYALLGAGIFAITYTGAGAL